MGTKRRAMVAINDSSWAGKPNRASGLIRLSMPWVSSVRVVVKVRRLTSSISSTRRQMETTTSCTPPVVMWMGPQRRRVRRPAEGM